MRLLILILVILTGAALTALVPSFITLIVFLSWFMIAFMVYAILRHIHVTESDQ